MGKKGYDEINCFEGAPSLRNRTTRSLQKITNEKRLYPLLSKLLKKGAYRQFGGRDDKTRFSDYIHGSRSIRTLPPD